MNAPSDLWNQISAQVAATWQWISVSVERGGDNGGIDGLSATLTGIFSEAAGATAGTCRARTGTRPWCLS